MDNLVTVFVPANWQIAVRNTLTKHVQRSMAALVLARRDAVETGHFAGEEKWAGGKLTSRKDVRVRSLHERVHFDAAVSVNCKAGLLRQSDVRLYFSFEYCAHSIYSRLERKQFPQISVFIKLLIFVIVSRDKQFVIRDLGTALKLQFFICAVDRFSCLSKMIFDTVCIKEGGIALLRKLVRKHCDLAGESGLTERLRTHESRDPAANHNHVRFVSRIALHHWHVSSLFLLRNANITLAVSLSDVVDWDRIDSGCSLNRPVLDAVSATIFRTENFVVKEDSIDKRSTGEGTESAEGMNFAFIAGE